MSEREFSSDDLPSPQEIFDMLKRNKRFIFVGFGLLFVVVMVFSSYFQVEPEEHAVVLRFGEPVEDLYGPGLHFKIPFVDEVRTVATQRQERLEFGFRSDPGERTKLKGRTQEESLMLTGDLQLVHVQWSLIYKVGRPTGAELYDDVNTWLFDVKDQRKAIADISKSIMRQLVGDYSLHELLTVKKRELQELALRETQVVLRTRVPTGVVLTELSIRSTDVPDGARKAFDKFNQTEPEVQARLSTARADLDNVTGSAEFDKKRAVGQAQRTYAQIVQNAEGEAGAFLEQLTEYRLAKDITREWLYLQKMTRVLSGVDHKILLDGGDASTLKLLPLTELMKGAVPAPRPAAPEVTP